MKLFFLVLVGFIAAMSVKAQSRDCAGIDADLDRLACYDLESGRTPETEVLQSNSKWMVSSETSKMTDQTNVYMILDSNDPVQCKWASGGTTPALIIRCSENTTSVYFRADCHLTASKYNNYGDVTYRLDNAKARTKGFQESTDNRALGLWRGGSAIPFIKEMFGRDKILIRFTPYGEGSKTAEFTIGGLEAEIQPLRKACKW